ncbi:MAG: mRNA surveillance protein pelota [Candidatus Diapherotrites archaeon]|nr:mRNA surveillance protein pelota [Candidatus Diapherotrites archaeon]
MRVLKRALPKIVVVAETLDDLWHLEKVIEKDDLVTAKSERRFTSEGGRTERKPITVTIKVEAIELHKHSNKLRLLGTIVRGYPEDYVQIGTHHTIEVMPQKTITIEKVQWKRYQLQRIKEAVEASKRPKVLLVVMDDESAEIALLREFGLEQKGTIRSGRSGKAFKQRDVMQEYFHNIAKALEQFDTPKVIVAGPGFTKDDFATFCAEKYPELRKRLITEDIGGVSRAGMQELLKRDVIKKIMEKARVVQETNLIERVLTEIAKDSGLVAYGRKEVEEALQYGAVQILLISDTLFSEEREAMENLLQQAEQTNVEVHIISSEHEAGEKLKHLGGIAALLRFRID